jgi:hypothetical protein
VQVPGAELPRGDVQCWLQDWRAWRAARGEPFPVPPGEVPASLAAFRIAETPSASQRGGRRATAGDRRGRFGPDAPPTTFGAKWEDAIGVDADGAGGVVRFVRVSAVSRLAQRTEHPHARLKLHYDRFEACRRGGGARRVESSSILAIVRSLSFWIKSHPNFACLAWTTRLRGTPRV